MTEKEYAPKKAFRSSSRNAGQGAFHSSNLKIENVDVKEWYSITMNPSDDHQYWGAKERQKMFVNWAQLTFYRILLNTDYILYLELSPAGRLHWHGKIRFRNKERLIKFYMDDINKLNKILIFEIDTIKDKDVWDTYIQKQYSLLNVRISSNDKINKLALIDVVAEIHYKKIPINDDD